MNMVPPIMPMVHRGQVSSSVLAMPPLRRHHQLNSLIQILKEMRPVVWIIAFPGRVGECPGGGEEGLRWAKALISEWIPPLRSG